MQGWATVSILGTLGADAEVRALSNGSTKTELRVAITRAWKDASGQKREETTWLRCIDWNKRPDWLLQKLTKGSPVAIQGRLSESVWEREGKKLTRIEVIVENLEALAKPQFTGEKRFPDNSGSIQHGSPKQDDDNVPF